MSNKNEVFEYLIDQLRQQVNSHPYKQQCEDLAHKVQSLKNQLRDAFERETELQKALNLLGRQVSVLVNRFPHEPEQYGCGKELDVANSTVVRLIKEGVQRCYHVWYRYNLGGYTKMCTRCGLKR